MKFPYWVGTTSVPLPPLGGSFQRYRPIIRVGVIGPTNSVTREGLLDTGSDDTVLPETVAQQIGLDLTHAPQLVVNLVGRGPVQCRYAQVRLRITDNIETCEWEAMVGFVSVPLTHFLLGYAAFLQFFDADFHGADREVILTPNPTFPGQIS